MDIFLIYFEYTYSIIFEKISWNQAHLVWTNYTIHMLENQEEIHNFTTTKISYLD